MALAPARAADAKPDADEALKRAPGVLKEVLAGAKDDKHLTAKAKEDPTVEEFKTDSEAGASLRYETNDSWPDLPNKPKGKAPGNGGVQVKIIKGKAKASLDAPFQPPKGCHYALSVYGTDVPGVQVSLWSMTADRAAHARLEGLVRARLKAAGVTMDDKPLSEPVRGGDKSEGPE